MSSSAGPAGRRDSFGSGVASNQERGSCDSSSSSSTHSTASSVLSDGPAAASHAPWSLAAIFCCGLRPTAARSTASSSRDGKHSNTGEGSSRQGASRRKRAGLFLLLTALVLIAACGMGVGVYFGMTKQPKERRARAAAASAAGAAALRAGGSSADAAAAAAAVGPVAPMNFQVVLAVPAVSAEQGCSTWFSNEERLDQYKLIFAASYTAALQQHVPESAITSINCAGSAVYTVVYTSGSSNTTTSLPAAAAEVAPAGSETFAEAAGAAASQPSRHLLAEPSTNSTRGTRALTLQFVRQSPLSLVEVVTRFRLPAPASHAERTAIAEAVVTGSSAILSGPMSEFFKVPSALMNFMPWSNNNNNINNNADNLEMGSQSLGTQPTIVPSVSYSAAPTCLFPLTKTNSMADDEGRLWSMMAGKECVFRPAAAPIPKPVVSWSDAPLCDDEADENNSVVDDSGRLWGWQDGASCAFKRSDSARPSSHGRSGKRMAASSRSETPGRVSVVWEAAPSCSFSPSKANAMPDTHGRLWGWEDGKSCVFRWQSLPA